MPDEEEGGRVWAGLSGSGGSSGLAGRCSPHRGLCSGLDSSAPGSWRGARLSDRGRRAAISTRVRLGRRGFRSVLEEHVRQTSLITWRQCV